MTDKTSKITDLNKKVLSNPIHFLAFGFGSGLAPFAPGTFGTLMAIPLYLLMQSIVLTTISCYCRNRIYCRHLDMWEILGNARCA